MQDSAPSKRRVCGGKSEHSENGIGPALPRPGVPVQKALWWIKASVVNWVDGELEAVGDY